MKNVKKVLKSVAAVSLFAVTLVACQKEQITKSEVSKTEIATTKGPSNITPVAFGPDLVVTSITTSMLGNINSPCGGPVLGAVCGQLYTAQITVKNIGNAAVTNSYSIRYGRVSGTPQTNDFTSPTSSLAPGATHTFNIPPASYSTCSGTFNIEQLQAYADIYNEVAETKEGNNRSRITKYCTE